MISERCLDVFWCKNMKRGRLRRLGLGEFHILLLLCPLPIPWEGNIQCTSQLKPESEWSSFVWPMLSLQSFYRTQTAPWQGGTWLIKRLVSNSFKMLNLRALELRSLLRYMIAPFFLHLWFCHLIQPMSCPIGLCMAVYKQYMAYGMAG